MNCVIVDDNRLARLTMRKLVEQVGDIDLLADFGDPLQAFNYLKENEVDLVLLDVEMPGMSGLELVRSLPSRPIVVLITAKEEYAVEAFELNVADYIVKPVTLARFLKAITRVRELYNSRNEKLEWSEKEKDYIFVRSNSVLTKIRISDIIYIQALGDYINIYTGNTRNTVHLTLKGIEEKLGTGNFYRVHRSYLIAVDHVDRVEEGMAYIGKHPIPIGEQYKKDLLKNLNMI